MNNRTRPMLLLSTLLLPLAPAACAGDTDDPVTVDEEFADKGWTTLYTEMEQDYSTSTWTPDGSIFMSTSFYNNASGGHGIANFNKSRFNPGPAESTVFGYLTLACEDGSFSQTVISERLADTNDRHIVVDCPGVRAVNVQFLLHVDE